MRVQASFVGERRGCRQLDVRACRLGVGAVRGRPSLVGMSTIVACKAGCVGTSAGSAVSGAQTAAALPGSATRASCASDGRQR